MSARLTVVTIGRNDLSGYQRTLDSLRAQTCRDVEHVVVDGASTDGGPAWVTSHPAVRDTQVVSEPDRGIYDAMNKGLRRASGELVVFMNAGDRFGHPDVLKVVRDSYEAVGWRWALGRGVMELADGTQLTRRRRDRYGWWRQTFWHYTVCHQAVYMQTEFLRELGGFALDLEVSADYELTTRAGRISRPHQIDEVCARVLAGGVSVRRPARTRMEDHVARARVLEMRGAARSADAVWQRALNVKGDAKSWVRAWLRRRRDARAVA